MRIVTAFLLFFIAASANAACNWGWDCTNGECIRVPLCESTTDIVMPAQPEVAPIPMPSIDMPQMPTIPPVGTDRCGRRHICEYGRCAWKTVCR